MTKTMSSALPFALFSPLPSAARLTSLSSAVLLIGAGLTACTDSDEDSAEEAMESTAQAEEAPLIAEDTWTRATDAEMTGVFGEITNSGEEDVEIVSARSAEAETVELHEVVVDDDGVEQMRQIEGGFPVPAGGSLQLEPGDDHLMLMGLDQQLHPGDSVEIILTLSDDTELSFEAMVKDEGGDDAPYDEEDSAGDNSAEDSNTEDNSDSHGNGDDHDDQDH